MPQIQCSCAGNVPLQDPRSAILAFGQLVEILQRKHIGLGGAGGDGVAAAWAVVPKGMAAKEVAASVGCQVFLAGRANPRQ